LCTVFDDEATAFTKLLDFDKFQPDFRRQRRKKEIFG
jgi:hypothetical protein